MNKPLMYSGFHAVEALLRHRPEAVLELFVQDTRADRDDPRLAALMQAAKDFGIAIQRARREVLEKHAGPQNQGIVARARPRRPLDESALLQWLDGKPAKPLLLVLENVTDPHNLGACLRSADAAGVQAVIVPRRNAAGLTPVACRTAVGAAESLAYYEIGNLASLLDQLRDRGVWVVGTALEERSESLFTFQAPESLAVVMGAEGSGLKRLTRDKCDQLLEIPMAGEVQSLNVSVATGVMLFQVRAQRSVE
ncbi:MAG: RNA methyltransferase [Alcanivorax borkumensis]|jgi:23S rRNA (guanosine2251-2'-O)-methyltransferase|uniref:RNA methyltransferase, TrmH family, group 3 n=1 Tax=Alcanivorax borkumensis (strain ATCC 700651 / DSM 11573 / NCIMB 13689 / SK2) TaxID=393595 RepID=Q0VMF8_ALCBS|nr:MULTISPECIES: 23S rRNA (guanosine(2251)-2'-O)-methyltransferase RlmB [Alcanivorax]OJH07238.1 MAG: RNA methyltransferase [Alcanivorax borkumensis]EUC68621.1 RNA methyltransferase [Alcanivorax sp. 97CO-5]PKG01020.1 23S rRNA (guanosine(2251)-2'-O)-methyltransferase RlmB [Alcanivorax sp. 97CO-6]CAL17640.1 RNA methyltransferase, TrmH family, group 3 [Alcanivorax borkumensis SK2]BAP15097.1 RNA methyltransferase [Alcanivorax sp. NBRC 101098]